MFRSMITVILLWTLTTICAQQRKDAFEINQRLGRGINMGNTFEAPSEDAWGNPWQPEYFEIMANLGFDHVRLPVRWEPEDRSLSEAPYTISADFLEKIKTVVDKALDEGLMIILNMHHHEALYADPEGEKARFLSQWSQIADYFRDYPQDLLFEVLNEPHGALTPQRWNTFFSEALEVIRTTNPNRVVLMGTAEYGGLQGLPYIQLPDDENIIVSVHYYNPFPFTHQGAEWVGDDAENWLGTQWYDTEAERETIENEFQALLNFSETNHIPVHIGEFGAYSKADMDSRARWTTFLARWFEQQGFSWAYWEFSAGFGIYDPNTQEFYQPLVDALLNNPMPDPTEVHYSVVYDSDFSEGLDGWNFYLQGGAAGDLSHDDQKIVARVETSGTEAWHAQMVKSGISLEQGVMYRLSILAGAGSSINIPVYIGKASTPWNSYSGTFQLNLDHHPAWHSFSFIMTEPSDANSRIVFDIGLINEQIELEQVKLEKVSLDLAVPAPGETGISMYPNPVRDVLYFVSENPVNRVKIMDRHGRVLLQKSFAAPSGDIKMNAFSPGLYFAIISLENGQTALQKIMVL
ncbi:cellulase family glycosylhydrolase [Thermophagus sp. OGC60D27]|uniref:cellulase family glycosylhydrolase n=1 Tax=Thermophagus sp. OGC60D27 TaxID=3458415 RepID=UPI004037C504